LFRFVDLQGQFATQPGKNAPCLIYADYNDKIIVYHDLDLHNLAPMTLIDKLSRDSRVLCFVFFGNKKKNQQKNKTKNKTLVSRDPCLDWRNSRLNT
jgi:hypothetical protein